MISWLGAISGWKGKGVWVGFIFLWGMRSCYGRLLDSSPRWYSVWVIFVHFQNTWHDASKVSRGLYFPRPAYLICLALTCTYLPCTEWNMRRWSRLYPSQLDQQRWLSFNENSCWWSVYSFVVIASSLIPYLILPLSTLIISPFHDRWLCLRSIPYWYSYCV